MQCILERFLTVTYFLMQYYNLTTFQQNFFNYELLAILKPGVGLVYRLFSGFYTSKPPSCICEKKKNQTNLKL